MANRSNANKHSELRRKSRSNRRQLLVQSLERRELLAAGPRLISVNPNADEILSPSQSNLLSVRPTELTFRFGGTSDIDASTLDAIRITRAGGDGQFGDANDVVVTPGYIGFTETNRVVVTRFADALPDDFYRIDVLASDDPALGTVGLRDVNGDLLQPSDPNASQETMFFELELGARVTAVVPQPVVGTGPGRTQLTQQVHVYFDDPDLFNGPNGPDASLTDPAMYKLIRTGSTISPGDDAISLPNTVTVNAALNRVELDFGADLHTLPGTGIFRLRIGTDESVTPALQTETPAGEVGSIAASAHDLGTLTGNMAKLVQGQAIVGAGLPMDYPGANNEEGHRQIQDEDHLAVPPDQEAGIAQRTYTVRNGLEYGLNTAGQPVFSSINPEQQQRVREIFDFYGELMGIDFVEVDTLDIDAVDHAVVVGDLAPNGGVSGPGGAIGLAANPGLLAIMDGAENWDNTYGGEFFETAMHEIGHLLGLGHTYDLPGGTIMGNTPELTSTSEFVFPGDNDIVHGQLLYRPDNRDVDMYRFDIGAGEAGRVKIETIAERLVDSSNLDTHLTLYRQNSVGALEKIAANDDLFGNDSYISLDLEEGTYFIGVVAQGNEVFDPTKDDTGSGGSSEGRYELRIQFKSSSAPSILDTAGTAIDGDGDGIAGGSFNFWFKANDPAATIYVDPSASVVGATGSLATPFRTLTTALAAATAGSVIRLLPSSGLDLDLTTTDDNRAYEIGEIPSLNAQLADGANFVVPAGVTVMVEPGVIFKMLGSRIAVGSGAGGIDASGGAIQVLGTPDNPVTFTSYNDASIAINTNQLDDTPAPGDWGGIRIRNDIDRGQGRLELEREGIFLNYVAGAEMRYGGGQVRINNQFVSVSPIDLSAARPTLIGNFISESNAAAISATPESFEETTFNEPRYQRFGQFVADYGRTGPQIYSNSIVDNSINGLFVRVDSDASGALRQLEVPGRFANTEIVHVLGENLLIRGNPGGAVVDDVLPGLELVAISSTTASGTLPAGNYQYRVSFVDANGYETQASAATLTTALAAAGTITLSGLPQASGTFVARRLYRSVNGGAFEFVADLNRTQGTFADTGVASNPNATAILTPIARPRPDARLAMDPGIVVKSSGVRIQTGFGADLIVEGVEGRPVVLTSRTDDRYGAGGTFNTNNSLAESSGSLGAWAGLYASPFSTLSLDHAVVAYAGGNAGAAGGTVGFNAVEIRQANARIAHTLFESNASGVLAGHGTRSGLGPNEAAVIYVAGAQPVIVENVFKDNAVSGTAMISIDANAMTATPLDDYGRQTGFINPIVHPPGNVGPLVRGNSIADAGIGGLRVRGGTLTTETVWDDTDMVHVLEGQILVPDFHTYGGLRLQSRFNESLVAKFGPNATLIADGRPTDVEDRVGGRVQVLGAPGFPVVMTSLNDDTVGAGFDPLGLPYRDTNGNGASVGAPGQWRGIQLKEFSNDRNVATVAEREGRVAGGQDANGTASRSQNLGEIAPDEKSGDENLRLGYTVLGSIADPVDVDVYSFVGTAGTLVWIDLDRTGAALDSVIEIVDADGNVWARSDNSHLENQSGALPFVDGAIFPSGHATPMPRSAFAEPNAVNGTYRDLYSINPLDAGMRIVLPGVPGSVDEYFVRVRGADNTTGSYQLQVRLREDDEQGGSVVNFANISFAQIGIDTSGMPLHSLLSGEAGVNPAAPIVAVSLGNLLSTDRSALSASGNIATAAGINTFDFTVRRDNLQSGGNGLFTSVTIDVDYADGFGRPNTSLFLYRNEGVETRLIATGTDSNIATDRGTPDANSDITDLSRGSAGARDAFIGTLDLEDGDYTLVVSNNSQMDNQLLSQLHSANAAFPLLRIEPIDSVQRIAEDRNFTGATAPQDPPFTTALPAVTVAFSGLENAVEYSLADVNMFIAGTVNTASRLSMNNPQLGTMEAVIGNDFTHVTSIAMDPRGRLVGYAAPVSGQNDGNTGGFILLDDGASYATFANIGNSGLETFEAFNDNNGNPTVGNPVGTNNARNGDGMVINALGFRVGSSTGNNRMYGVGSRGNGETQFRRVVIFPDNSIGLGAFAPTQNVLYRLNPDSGAVIDAGPARTGNQRALGAGTDGVEVGYLQTNANDITGDVTGVTFIGNRLFGVTSTGQLFTLANVPDTNVNPNGTNNLLTSAGVNQIITLNDPVTGLPISFSGLTTGPNDADGGIHSNTLFGIASNGMLYAIGSNIGVDYGQLQPVFARGDVRIDTGVTGAKGIDFSNLDVNLWGVTNNRGNDPGHGQNVNSTTTRATAVNGGNSLYFGFSNSGVVSRDGTWNAGFDPSSRSNNSYNFAGGAKGTITSHTLDLSDYSIEDKPTMYFNYFLNSEDSSALINASTQMRDSLRVYGQGDDGAWRLLATNNLAGYNNNFSQWALNDPNNQDEFDMLTSGMFDANLDYSFVQRLFNADEWRQARIPLAPFAGSENVKIRIEFSSAGEPDRDTLEIQAVPGSQIVDQDTFDVSVPGTAAVTFEFEHGLVLDVPTGALITEGDTLNVDGTTFTFSSTPGANVIVFSPNDPASAIRDRVAAALGGLGLGPVFTSPNADSLVNLPGATIDAFVTGGLTGVDMIVGQPGVAPGNTPVFVNIGMDTQQVRDAIRDGLALGLNVPGQETNTDLYPVSGDTIRVFGGSSVAAGPLKITATSSMPGANSGVNLVAGEQPTGASALDRLRIAGTRGQNNGFEGVYIDDVIIGFAERGELITGYDTAAGRFLNNNPEFQPIINDLDAFFFPPTQVTEVRTGFYQVEIRTSAEYALVSGNRNTPFVTFDTNDVIGEQTLLDVVGSGADIADGDSFTLSDGVNVVCFEFNNIEIPAGSPFAGVTSGSIEIPFRHSDTSEQIATTIRDLINGAAVQATFDVLAASPSGVFGTDQLSTRILLHGRIAADQGGGLDTGLTNVVQMIRQGLGRNEPVTDPFNPPPIYSLTGDSNRVRQQGQIIISNNIIADSSQFGILVSAGDRDRSAGADIIGPLASTTLPRPGSPINFPTPNTGNLLPSVVISNNILVDNRSGGINIIGDNGTGPVPVGFARVVNNTIVGRNSGDVGIRVEGNSSPTIANNAIVNQATGVAAVNVTGPGMILNATLFANNNTKTTAGVPADPNEILVTAGEPLFLDAARRNYIPAAFSQLIDSSNEFIADRTSTSILRQALGIRLSPIIAPARDLTGQLRVNDPTVDGGTGANVYIDRGAIDRSDATGPIARLIRPLDNDVAGNDVDLGETFVRLLDGTLDYFEIQLDDPFGTGPDSLTVLEERVIVTENGERLFPGVDYTFGFSDTINVIRLTPLSGIWKPGAAYEITLNNRQRQVISVPTGDQISDGDRVVVTDNAGTVATFEFDTGFVATIPAGGVTEGDRVIYTSQNRVRRIEWLLDGTTRTQQPNTNYVISYTPADSPQLLAEKLAEAFRSIQQGLETSRAIEGARVYVGGQAGDVLEFEGAALPVTGTPGVPAGVIAVPVVPSSLLNTDVVAGQLVAAISRAAGTTNPPLQTRAFTPGGGTVWLERTSSVTGLPGGGVWSVDTVDPILDLAGNSLQPNRANGETQFTILMPGVQLDFGDSPFSSLIVDNGARHVLADSALPRLGQLIDAEANGSASDEASPQLIIAVLNPALADSIVSPMNAPAGSIVIGGVAFDPLTDVFAPQDGDAIRVSIAGRSVTFELTSDTAVGAGNIGIVFDPLTATRESVAASLADAINSQSWQIAVATVDSTDPFIVHLAAFDEDGVGVGAIQLPNSPVAIDGLFVDQNGNFLGFLNPLDGSTEISVQVTGSGLLDAWIDYDQSGDYSGIGEQVLTNALVLDGNNRFRIPVLPNALEGMTWLRLRLSATGNQTPEGVAIGGEVEDYNVRVVSVVPPTLVDDQYSVDEDNTLSVGAADGVLLGAGADAFAGLSNVQAILDDSPLFGTVTLDPATGAFVYTPVDNFYGTDRFTYRISAERRLDPNDPNSGILPILSSDLATVTIDVNPINDVPFALDSGYIALEDDGTGTDILTITAADLLNGSLPGDFSSFPISPDAPWNESAQTLRVSSLTVDGVLLAPTGTGPETLTASTGQGTLITANFDMGGLVDLQFQPTNNYNRQNPIDPAKAVDPALAPFLATLDPTDTFDSFQFTVTDDGLTVFPTGMGVDDGNGNLLTQITIGEESVTHTAFVRVDPVNDDPEFGFIAEHTYNEDNGPVTVPTTLNLLPGPANAADESGQVVTFALNFLSGTDPTVLFATEPTIDSNGVLRFETALHQNGQVIYEVIATDDGPNDPTIGDDPSADPVTMTITIDPVNDAPEFTGTPQLSVLEDNGPSFDGVHAVPYASGIRPGPVEATDESGQALTFIVTPDIANDPALITTLPSIDPVTGVMSFTSGLHAVGSSVFYVQLMDDGRTDRNGIDISATQTVTITVDPVNDAPVFDLVSPQVVLEDSGPVALQAIENLLPGPIEADDEIGQVVTFALTPDSNNPSGLFSVDPTIDSSGVLRFTPAPNQVGSAVFVVIATDNGPNDPAIGDDPIADPVTLTITVTPVNDAPEFNGTPEIDVLEDNGPFVVQYATGILPGPANATDEQGQSLSFIVTADPFNPPGLITSTPTIDTNGVMRFNSEPDAVGSAVFYVRLRDNGGTANGGVDTSVAQTVTLNIRPVNDTPVVTTPQIVRSVLEDNTLVIQVSDIISGNFVVGPPNEADGTPGGNQSLFLVDFGTKRTANGTVSTVVDGNGVVTALTYTPDKDFNSGPNLLIGDQIFFTLTDDGTTFNLGTMSLDDTPLTVDFQVDLIIEPVNDLPSFSALTTSIRRLEDTGLVTVPGWATNISTGPATAGDETNPVTGQSLTFSITPAPGQDVAAYNALFSELPTVTPTGTLAYRTAPNAVGTAVVVVVAQDSGANDPVRGDVNTSRPVTLTLSLMPVNDAPVANPTSVSYTLDEDRSIVIPLTNGTNGLYDIFTVGPANEADGTFGGNQTLATDGTLYPRSTTGGGSISAATDSNGNFVGLLYTPAPDFNGQDSFVYGVRDNGSTFNLNTGSLNPDAKESYATVSLTINPVNDRPQFSGGVDVSVSEDVGSNNPSIPPANVGLSQIDQWATNILAGPATALDELTGPTSQTVTFEIEWISGADPAVLFEELPTVNPATGQLRFKTNPNANGNALFRVTAVDSGPTGFLNNDPTRPENLNRSISREFEIEVVPANDPPTFTAGGNVTVTEDSGPYNSVWATNILPGPADEVTAGQAVSFDLVVSPADANKFSVLPTISDSGVLRFIPADNANGDVVVEVTARDTLGAISSPTVSLTITIDAINDAPVAVDDQLSTSEDGVFAINSSVLISNDEDVDLPNDALVIINLSGQSLQGALITLSADGTTVNYDPSTSLALQSLKAGESINDTFTYQVRDLSGLESEPATVTINVSGANDAPIAVNDIQPVSVTGATSFNPLANDSDVDGTLNPASLIVTLQPAFGSLSVDPATGRMTYTPFAGFSGEDLIRYVVRDDLGALSNQASITIGVNEQPVANNDSVQTFRNEGITFNPLANDSDPENQLDPQSIDIVIPPSNGLAIVNADGTVTYEPRAGFFGIDQLVYTVSDRSGATSNIATVDIRVIASRLQNPVNALDVNDSGQVSPIDALLVINHLNRGGSTSIDPLLPGPPYYDVNGDLTISPVDALQVINALNRQLSGSGEGENVAAPSVMGTASAIGFSSSLLAEGEASDGQITRIDSGSDKLGCSAWESFAHDNNRRFDSVIDSLIGPAEGDDQDAIDELWAEIGGGEGNS